MSERKQHILDMLSYREVQKLAGTLELRDRRQKKILLVSRIMDSSNVEQAIADTFSASVFSNLLDKLGIESYEDPKTAVLSYIAGRGARRNSKKKENEGPLYAAENEGDLYVAENEGDLYAAENEGDLYAAENEGDLYTAEKKQFAKAEAMILEQSWNLYGDLTDLSRPSGLIETPKKAFQRIQTEEKLIKRQDMEYNRSLFIDSRKAILRKVDEQLERRSRTLEENFATIVETQGYFSLNGLSDQVTKEEKRLLRVPERWRTGKDAERLRELQEARSFRPSNTRMLIGIAEGGSNLEIVIDPRFSRFITLPGHRKLLDIVAVLQNMSEEDQYLLLPLDDRQTEALLKEYPHIVDMIVPDLYYQPAMIRKLQKDLKELEKTIDSL